MELHRLHAREARSAGRIKCHMWNAIKNIYAQHHCCIGRFRVSSCPANLVLLSQLSKNKQNTFTSTTPIKYDTSHDRRICPQVTVPHANLMKLKETF